MPPAPPPLQLPVSDSVSRSRTTAVSNNNNNNNNNNSQPQSYLTSPVGAKTSTIHFSAADSKPPAPKPTTAASLPKLPPPLPGNSSFPNNNNNNTHNAKPPSAGGSTPLPLKPATNSAAATSPLVGSPRKSNTPIQVNNASFSSSPKQGNQSNNTPMQSMVQHPNRPPPREERPVGEYFLRKQQEANDPYQEIKDKLREKLHAFFFHYSPHLFHEVDDLVKRFWNSQETLWLKLHQKYGPDPQQLPRGMDTKSRLVRFFRKYEPSLEQDIPKIMNSYGGYEGTMWRALTQKYGPELSLEESEGTGGKYKVPMDLLSRLKRFFKQHDMAKLAKASEMAKTYDTKEADLRTMLKLIYNAELEVDPEAAERELREAKERDEAAKKENDVQEKETKKWLVAFLQQHNPKRMGEVDALLAHFKGRQDALKDTVVAIFGTKSIDYNTPRLRLIRIYQKYNPAKLEEVETLLDRFKDRYEELFTMLKDKYSYEQEPEYKPDEYAAQWIEQQEHKMPAKMTEKTKKRLQLFFLTYDPKLASSTEHVMVLYRGKEEEMWRTLIERYGPEPEFVDLEEEKRKKAETDKAERERLEAERAAKERADARFKVRVTRMYRRYNPRKVSEVATVISKYEGREEELMQMLVNKYGDEEYFTAEELDHEIDGAPLDPFMRDRIIRMYHKYNPTKLGELDDIILPKYVGKEEELIAGLCAKYGPEPAWGEGNSIRDRATRFYMKYKPNKLDQLELVMEKYIGKDEELIKMLTEKYGPEPTYMSDAERTQRETDARRKELSAAADAMQTNTVNRSVSFSSPDNNNSSNNNNNNTKARLMKFYQHYDPAKATDEQVNKVLAKYDGKEGQLFEMLVDKYGEEPSGAIAGDNSGDSAPSAATRDKVVRYYTKYDPGKLDNVDKVLKKFAGRDAELMEMLEVKYGPLPPPEQQQTQQQPQTNNNNNNNNNNSTNQNQNQQQKFTTTREKLEGVYRKYDISKMEVVEKILQKYAGRDEVLFDMLVDKYGQLTEFGIYSKGSTDDQPPARPSASSSSNAAPQPTSTKDKLTAIYKKYDPSKISNVDTIVQKYAGKENVLFEMLEDKYGDLSEFGIGSGDAQNNISSSAYSVGSPPGSPATSRVNTTTTTTAATPGNNNPTGNSYRDRVTRIYNFYEPAKAAPEQIDKVMNKYDGKEGQLMEMLVDKYGPEPEMLNSPNARSKVRFTVE